MGKIVRKNQSCLSCKSSDARQIYEDGSSYCFSCGTAFSSKEKTLTSKEKNKSEDLEEIKNYPIRGFKDRGIEKEICEIFGVRVSYDETGNIKEHYYPYGISQITGYKVRLLPKEFRSIGNISGSLFGQKTFSTGGKRLVITEGEIDALSVAQASYKKYKTVYPVVAIPSATSKNVVLKNRDWIRSFDEVVVWVDNDEPGEKCKEELVKIIGFDKVKVVKSKEKDANEVLVEHGYEKVLQYIWNAEARTPVGIVTKDEIWKQLEEYNELTGISYPECLQGVGTKLKSIRLGEIVLLISGTGSGKSTIVRELLLHIIDNTEESVKVGGLFLEESPAETARKLSGMRIERNPDFEELTIEDIKPGFEQVFQKNRVVLVDHQGSLEDDKLIEQLEYMCLIGCKYIFIDHITILASEGTDGLTENQAVDKIMSDLLKLVKRHNIWIGLVSHLRKASNGAKSFEEGRIPSIDDIKGSGSIKQISFDIIAFARNLIAESEEERNTIRMRILKSRRTGLTGDVAGARYDLKTGRLKGIESVVMDSEF